MRKRKRLSEQRRVSNITTTTTVVYTSTTTTADKRHPYTIYIYMYIHIILELTVEPCTPPHTDMLSQTRRAYTPLHYAYTHTHKHIKSSPSPDCASTEQTTTTTIRGNGGVSSACVVSERASARVRAECVIEVFRVCAVRDDTDTVVMVVVVV